MRKTSISFGLVNIPISMNPIYQNNDVSFNQLHKKCLSRINMLSIVLIVKKKCGKMR